LPAALLVVLWWQRGRLHWRRDVLPLLPWLAGGAAAGLFTAWVERKFIGAAGPEYALTLVQRCLIAGRALWFYLGKLVWPANLTFVYPRWTVDAAVWWQYAFPVGALAAGLALFLLARFRRGPLAAFLFFAGTLFPALGFFNVYPFVYSYVADHYQYLASLGVIVPISAGLAMLVGRMPARARRIVPLLGGMLLVMLGGLAWRQSGTYRDAETLYASILARNPACWLAENNLGKLYLDTPGRVQEAIPHLEAALRLKPDNFMPHYNLGAAFTKIPGRLPEALAEYEAALRIKPDLADAHDGLAKALLSAGRPAEAIAEFRAALRLMPGVAAAHNNLGTALAMTGSLQEAIAEFQAALRLDPDFDLARFNLEKALAHASR